MWRPPTLTPQDSITLPANVQYAWPHPSRQFLYVVRQQQPAASAARWARPARDKNHYAIAYRGRRRTAR